jgi:hypothetical protein
MLTKTTKKQHTKEQYILIMPTKIFIRGDPGFSSKMVGFGHTLLLRFASY